MEHAAENDLGPTGGPLLAIVRGRLFSLAGLSLRGAGYAMALEEAQDLHLFRDSEEFVILFEIVNLSGIAHAICCYRSRRSDRSAVVEPFPLPLMTRAAAL